MSELGDCDGTGGHLFFSTKTIAIAAIVVVLFVVVSWFIRRKYRTSAAFRDQWHALFGPATPKRVLAVLVVIGLGLLIVVCLYRVKCRFFKPQADPTDVDQVVEYLRVHASQVPQVAFMCTSYKTTTFPRTYIDLCGDEELAYQCKFLPEEISIGQSIWESHGPDALAYRSLAFFAEYQHTRLGNFQPDNQATQEILESVRRCFPKEDRSMRVNCLHHKGTENHE